jgi:hypothetical protein
MARQHLEAITRRPAKVEIWKEKDLDQLGNLKPEEIERLLKLLDSETGMAFISTSRSILEASLVPLAQPRNFERLREFLGNVGVYRMRRDQDVSYILDYLKQGNPPIEMVDSDNTERSFRTLIKGVAEAGKQGVRGGKLTLLGSDRPLENLIVVTNLNDPEQVDEIRMFRQLIKRNQIKSEDPGVPQLEIPQVEMNILMVDTSAS